MGGISYYIFKSIEKCGICNISEQQNDHTFGHFAFHTFGHFAFQKSCSV